MRLSILIAILIGLTGCTSRQTPPNEPDQAAHQHHETDPGGHQMAGHEGHAENPESHHSAGADSELIITTDPPQPAAETSTNLKMMIHDTGGSMVRDFDVIHEERVHLIIVHEGLDQFAHIHPQIDSEGNITTSFTFPVAGTSFLYADHQPTGKAPTVARGQVDVAGEAPPAPALVPNAPGRVKGDELEADIAVADAASDATRITFTLADSQGAVTDLQPYLGAMGHLVILSADGSQYVHAHPAGGERGLNNVVVFETHFPQPGLYKGWGQFQRQGEVHTVPFVIQRN